MTTCVAKHPRATITVAHREQRHTEGHAFDMVTGVRDGRGRNEHAGRRTEQPELVGEPGRIEIILDRLAPGVTLIGRSRIDMREDAANDLDIIGEQRLCGATHVKSITLCSPHVKIYVI